MLRRNPHASMPPATPKKTSVPVSRKIKVVVAALVPITCVKTVPKSAGGRGVAKTMGRCVLVGVMVGDGVAVGLGVLVGGRAMGSIPGAGKTPPIASAVAVA